MLKIIGITLVLASSASAALAADKDEAPVLYHAILAKPSAALNTASGTPNYGPYPNECAAQVKKNGSGNASAATGTASFKYSPKSKKLEYVINYEGLSGPAMMAHFHYTPSGSPIVQTICGKPSVKPLAGVGVSEKKPLNGEFCNAKEHNANHGVVSGTYVLDGNKKINPPPTPPIATGAEEATELAAGQLFVNFHTCLNMGGEVMGTLVPGPLPKK